MYLRIIETYIRISKMCLRIVCHISIYNLSPMNKRSYLILNEANV